MDSASDTEPRERAVSSEPCSTRPNPFDDGAESARKRRRTSMSGASRSRSVDTVRSATQEPAAEAPGAAAMDEGAAREDATMKLDADTEPTTPQTPDRPADRPQPPSGPVSSRVTINLRSAQTTALDTIPSSPLSPQSPTPAPRSTDDEDVKISVEESEVDMSVVEDAPSRTPRSSASETDSPTIEAEVVDVDADDTEFAAGQPQVTLLHGMQGSMLQDPSRDFPYRNHSETSQEMMAKLTNYMTTHDDVTQSLREWIDSYLLYTRTLEYDQAFQSLCDHHSLWVAVPELIWSCTNLRAPDFMNIDDSLRTSVRDFCISFARLATHFVQLDNQTLRMSASASSNDNLASRLASPPYLTALNLLLRREPLRRGDLNPPRYDDINEIVHSLQTAHRKNGGTLALLYRFMLTHIRLASHAPRVIEYFGQICNVVSILVRECERNLHNPHHQNESDQNRQLVGLGHQFFERVSATLSIVIDKHVTALSFDNAASQVSSLSEIIQVVLRVGDPASAKTLDEYRRKHPMIRPECLPEVFAMEWRFTMFRRLIMSGQMQLRVMAVTTLCSELVGCWKRYGDVSEAMPSLRNAPVLRFVSDFLTSTGLVSYLLGPTCHPEITLESGNIIGFLAVTKTYTPDHTDLIWQTVTTTQDPRISDALLRMMSRIGHLFGYEALIHMCKKLLTITVDAFGSTMREFCESVFRSLLKWAHTPDNLSLDITPFSVCLRLLRQASVLGQRSSTAFPEIQTFAIERLTELLSRTTLDDQVRHELYHECVTDIAEKTSTTLGSLCAIHLISRLNHGRELGNLIAEYELTSLVIGELENAIQKSREAGCIPVISGVANGPRKDMVFAILLQHPSTITGDLGRRLWDMLFGKDAACQEDRDASWKILNNSLKRGGRQDNPFLESCFAKYLPDLPTDCFCDGLLEFIREVLLPLVNDPSSILLDDDESSDRGGIEQLWRIVLTAPSQTIERQAISTLVSDIYIDSKSILCFPHHRARNVHLALAARCLSQLSSAAKKLKSFSDGSSSGDDEPMVIVASDAQMQEQELVFVRSLAVLREFHRLYRARSHFAAPDLRSLISQTPGDVEGEPAELKFQSFDGDCQTDVQPLNIGKLNTAASLLASLKEATGFENYRIYYRGQAFVPHEGDICKSLAELQIENGLILVKREADATTSSVRIRPGASPVEIEILNHFEELWEYLSMDDRLAQEVYQFLVRLPVDDNVLKALQTGSVSHKEIFPLGQPFKPLYAIHALREYLSSRRRLTAPLQRLANQEAAQIATNEYADALARALSLTIAAICDHEVIQRCASQELQIFLSTTLVDSLVHVLKDPLHNGLDLSGLDAVLLKRLTQILTVAMDAPATEASARLIQITFQSILECCSASRGFWEAFRELESVSELLGNLLLRDWRPAVRKISAKFIGEKISYPQGSSVVPCSEFREFFWPVVLGLIPAAMRDPSKCEDTFSLCFTMFKVLRETRSPVLDIPALLSQINDLLLNYTTFEDITQPDTSIDLVAYGLIRMLHSIFSYKDHSVGAEVAYPRGSARQLFWKHLFPPWQDDDDGSLLPRVVLNCHSRLLLVQIIFWLVGEDQVELLHLVQDLDRLVPFDRTDDDEPYHYELSPQFERAKAIRSSCGYVGLRNLSNTCYLNSLFTQLFMNVEFRQFILSTEIRDEVYTQKLLFNTRTLFGYMQDSIRRYVDPHECVASIKTYDETPIDIHNQMDVDEFYNLLFDRWEGQLLTPEAKEVFRSFYGGQLVQQVRSQECEHVSEILEPFSAIQCDIKGKNSLQESLQAYVDGEIMQGENKYKCSTCDRHVDAVKRACLKDIPDNLIFHLKRFDFSLRSLQRSKINDYFAFPHKIDMRPYTIDQLSSPTEEKAADIFELVGVLVHSGTAESGHYYSYIRERPTSRNGEVWVEFNDDLVTPWDPVQMESSCFGGPDYRSNFDSNNLVMDKSYSAYMLFYQRATSLEKGQQVLVESAKPCPVRLDMPEELASHIRSENTWLVRRHCLYDPGQIPFVCMAMTHVQTLNGGECSENHRLEDMTMQMALGHLDQVASRTKDIPDFQSLLTRITGFCQSCPKCCVAVYSYFSDRPEALRQMVQRSPEPVVRQETANLLIRALQSIKQAYPEQYATLPDDEDALSDMDFDSGNMTVARGAVRMLQTFWETFHTNLRSWPEVFGLMLAFVNLGRYETALFVEHDNLKKALLVIAADPAVMTLDTQYTRLIHTLSRRLATRQPSYENLIALIDALLSVMYVQFNSRTDLYELDEPDRVAALIGDADALLPMNRQEFLILYKDWTRPAASVFVDKLISLNQNIPATESIIARLLEILPNLDSKFQLAIRMGITSQSNAPFITPYLRAGLVYCRHSLRPEAAQSLIRHVAEQCREGIMNAEGRSFFDFMRDVYGSVPDYDAASLQQSLEMLPVWAPGLLGYYDLSVSNVVEVFLQENIFAYEPSHAFDANEGGLERSKAQDRAARQLGIACLVYLKEVVSRKTHIGHQQVASLQRVVSQCNAYYDFDEAGGDESAEEFVRLSHSVQEPLDRLIVDDVDDDASGQDWEASDCSSDQMDSTDDIGIQTGVDLHEGDV